MFCGFVLLPKIVSDQLPFLLHEAVLTLYALGSDGPAGEPIWFGAVANGLKLGLEYEVMRMMSSGARFATAHHVDEEHSIEIERTWILRKPDLHDASVTRKDFVPERNARYALVIVWSAEGGWYQRTYLGVTGKAVGWDSKGPLQFGSRQAWQAERYEETADWSPPRVFTPSGVAPGPEGAVPPFVFTPLPPDEQSVGFFRENAMVVGEHLLGHYRWARNVKLGTVKAIAFAPQTTAQVLQLELNGVLQAGKTVTLPVGTANTEVSGTADLGGMLVTAGTGVRWKIVGGPSPESAAWVGAVAMQVSAV